MNFQRTKLDFVDNTSFDRFSSLDAFLARLRSEPDRPSSLKLPPSPRLRRDRPAEASRLSPDLSGRRRMVGPDGFEPSTPRLSSACSNQLSYEPGLKKSRSRSRWALIR